MWIDFYEFVTFKNEHKIWNLESKYKILKSGNVGEWFKSIHKVSIKGITYDSLLILAAIMKWQDNKRYIEVNLSLEKENRYSNAKFQNF